MQKTLLTFLIVLMLPLANAKGQGLNWALHVSNPISAIPFGDYWKVRLKGEFKIDPVNSLLLCYTHYWGDFAPGNTLGIEYRRYRSELGRRENYIYGEAGANRHYTLSSIGLEGDREYVAPYVGAGVGRHINYGHFFIDINAGLRFTYLRDAPVEFYYGTYYQYGPGTYVRLAFSFGFQYSGKTRKRHPLEGEF